MSGSAPIATHERAGCLEPARLGVRVSEPTAMGATGSAPLAGVTSLAVGTARCASLDVTTSVAAEGAAAQLDVRVRNAGDAPVGLQSVVLGFRWTGAPGRALRFLRHGWQSWSDTRARELDAAGEPAFPSGPWLRGLHHAVGTPPADRAGWHESELVGVVGVSPQGPTCCVGVLERGRAFGIVHLRRRGEAVEAEVELRVDAVLAPGEERELERVRLALGEDASVLLEEFAEEHGRLAGARTARPFVAGWCSWYHFFEAVREEDVLRNVEALAAARDALPLEVVQLDDGWQRAVGDWRGTNAKFPRGLAFLAEEIRAAGFVPGLWTAPFCAVPESELFAAHPEWLLRDGDGPALALLHSVWTPEGRVHALDPSRPEVEAHLEALFACIAEQGFLHLKLDFLYAACVEARAADPGTGRAARLRRGLAAIRRGAGEEAFLLGCGCPLGAAVGLVDGMRIGPDVAPRWDVDPAASVPGLEATLPAARNALRNALTRVWMHRRLWLNDPDCLVARQASDLDEGETRALAAGVAISGGVFLLSDDVPTLEESRRRLVAEALGAAREADGLGLPGRARALALLDEEVPAGVVAGDADVALAALLNAGEKPARRQLELGPLAAPPEPLLGSAAPAVVGSTLEAGLGPREGVLLRARHPAPLVVFCDFDGTFSVQDVGSTLARRHAGARRPEAWNRYERGELSAWGYNMEILDGLALPWSEVDRFLRTVDLDPGAAALVAWCEERGVPFRVLSDGFDANLNRLQQLHGVRFAYDANALRFEHGVWRIRATWPNPDCECGTGVCKRGRIEAARRRRPDATLVHVGNGRVSDLCGALAADLVFAKDSLAEELAQRGVAFEPFASLNDVVRRLAPLLGAAAPRS